jgi:hypothetical protein
MRALIGKEDRVLPVQEQTSALLSNMDAMRTFGYPVWSFETLAKYYARQTRRILQVVPAGRLLVCELEQLSSANTLKAILAFIQANTDMDLEHPDAITMKHRNRFNGTSIRMFSSLKEPYTQRVISETFCEVLEGLLDQHVTTFGNKPMWCKEKGSKGRIIVGNLRPKAAWNTHVYQYLNTSFSRALSASSGCQTKKHAQTANRNIFLSISSLREQGYE